MNVQVKIMFWNARCICGKIIEFFNFLIHKNIDICLVNETWLNERIRLSQPMFNVLRVDRPNRQGGGVAIVIKKKIKYQQLESMKTNVMENIGMSIDFDQFSFKLFCVYFPFSGRTSDLMPLYRRDIRKLLSIRGKYILCGDLNSKHRNWGCPRANVYGNLLNDLTLHIPFTIMYPNDPTHIPTSSRARPSTIDIILTNIPNYISQPNVLDSLSSDHFPVMFSLNASYREQENIRYNYNKTN